MNWRKDDEKSLYFSCVLIITSDKSVYSKKHTVSVTDLHRSCLNKVICEAREAMQFIVLNADLESFSVKT